MKLSNECATQWRSAELWNRLRISGQHDKSTGIGADGRGPDDSDDDDGEAPETPTDEPAPIPIVDPPSSDTPPPPMTVRNVRF